MKKRNLQQNKLFVVRKYVWALNAKDAICKELNQSPDDVWIDDEWKKNPPSNGQIGFYNGK